MPPSILVCFNFPAGLINPITYLVAFLIGAIINMVEGNSLFFSIVPYVVPLFVQGFAKASLRLKTRDIELLCQLPAERKDPAFVMDRQAASMLPKAIPNVSLNKTRFKRSRIYSAVGN